jgi:hypothetical protein
MPEDRLGQVIPCHGANQHHPTDADERPAQRLQYIEDPVAGFSGGLFGGWTGLHGWSLFPKLSCRKTYPDSSFFWHEHLQSVKAALK